MHIYDKQCEIMQKNQWKGPNFQIQCFYNGRSLTDRSSLLKTWKTRETKTWITQNFELVWPIQGRTMWKLTSWRFRKCGTFWDLKVLNQSYWLSKFGRFLTSLTFWSSLLKTWKTRETKTQITQNFELVWPIQGRTMWKLTSWGFQKCGSFRDLEVLNPSYRLSKSGQIQKKK